MEGLTTAAALEKLRDQGNNTLPSPESRSFIAIVKESFLDPMLALLVAAATIHLLLGQLQDSVALLLAVGLVIGLSVRQEWKSEKALQALRDLSAPHATVVRDGAPARVAAADVVVGDVLLLEAGDRVAADADLNNATDFEVDESLLTGESIPVRKERDTKVLAGSLVVRGRGTATVTATGLRSELGKIGHGLRSVTRVENPVARQLRTQVRRLAYGAIVVCGVVSLLHALRSGDWLTGLLAGLALAIAMVPEEFPVVSKIFLALGAWRLSAANVLTRNLDALQTLSHITVLVTDKTGTLTMNQLAVREVIPLGSTAEALIEAAVRASDSNALDPIDKAIVDEAHRRSISASGLPLHIVPVSMAAMHTFGDEDHQQVYAKGAPETIAGLCSMSPAMHAAWQSAVEAATTKGFKVLGVATGTHEGRLGEEPPNQLKPLGLISLLDPLRPDVKDSVAEAYRAGVRIVIATGDHAKTAETIARDAGIRVNAHLSGTRLESLSDRELSTMLRDHVLFSRVTPSQKLRLVTALKQAGEIVAMTGDGVNDAPALRAADVGIAMGQRGTDVAREAADMVLVNDDFASIVSALRMSRVIRERFERVVRYIIAVHVPIAALALVPFLFGWPLILLPLHIILLELVIDPACSMAFDAEPATERVMEEQPQRFASPLLGTETVLSGISHGLAAAIAVIIVFALSYLRVGDAADSRTLAFATLLLMNVALLWVFRSRSQTIWTVLRRRNAVLWAITGAVVVFLVIATRLDEAQQLLRLVELHKDDYLLIAGAVLMVITILDGQKLLRRWRYA